MNKHHRTMLQRRVAAAKLAYETALQILTAGGKEGRKNERECVRGTKTERDNLMSAIDQKDAFINKIKSWLVSEVNSYTELQAEISNGKNAEDICDQPEIFLGRHECAEGLLNQIEEWENK